MILNDESIKQLVKEKDLIEPFDKKFIDACSYDLHLDYKVMIPLKPIFRKSIVHWSEDYEERLADNTIIPPNTFILASTQETLNLPNDLVGRIEGLSTIGRSGLFVQNASLVKPGFSGKITLELFNASKMPIKIYEGMRIAQVVFETLNNPCSESYSGRYQHQWAVTAPIKDEVKHD